MNNFFCGHNIVDDFWYSRYNAPKQRSSNRKIFQQDLCFSVKSLSEWIIRGCVWCETGVLDLSLAAASHVNRGFNQTPANVLESGALATVQLQRDAETNLAPLLIQFGDFCLISYCVITDIIVWYISFRPY